MSDSTSLLDLISPSQAQKEVTANALLDAASPATLFGRRASTTSALTWGYYGGPMMIAGVPTAVANGTLALSASATNYIEVDAAGTVSKKTTAFTAGRTPLYTVVTGASTVTSYTDKRVFLYQPNNTPFDIAGYMPGVPAATVNLMRVVAARGIGFVSGLTGSRGNAEVAATAQTDFTLKLNGASVGTMRFAAAATTATFIAATPITVAAGDVLALVSPASPDATLAGVSFTLLGTR